MSLSTLSQARLYGHVDVCFFEQLTILFELWYPLKHSKCEPLRVSNYLLHLLLTLHSHQLSHHICSIKRGILHLECQSSVSYNFEIDVKTINGACM